MAFEWRWLRGTLDDPAEKITFAALKIVLNGHLASRIYDRDSGTERDAVHVALHPLASGIAENWWSLLYEPRKPAKDNASEIRHSLDSYMAGFVFPALTLWSAGDDAVAVEVPAVSQLYSNLEFLRSSLPHSLNLPRQEIEDNLFKLVDDVSGRLSRIALGDDLNKAWDRVRESLADEEERRYCIAAGQLGIDPYDADAQDISGLAGGLSDKLFSDICDAVSLEELTDVTIWAREGSRRLKEFPEVNVREFGTTPPVKYPEMRGADYGYKSARDLRRTLGLEGEAPRSVIDRIFGTAVRGDALATLDASPVGLDGIAGRLGDTMRVAIPPRLSARRRRSTLCRAAYLAWRTGDGDASAVTTATTLEQQASRAFAAELLTPAEWLRERAGSNGLTQDDIEKIAEENICPEPAVIWQAYNHGIPLRGVMLPN